MDSRTWLKPLLSDAVTEILAKTYRSAPISLESVFEDNIQTLQDHLLDSAVKRIALPLLNHIAETNDIPMLPAAIHFEYYDEYLHTNIQDIEHHIFDASVVLDTLVHNYIDNEDVLPENVAYLLPEDIVDIDYDILDDIGFTAMDFGLVPKWTHGFTCEILNSTNLKDDSDCWQRFREFEINSIIGDINDKKD